MIKLKYKKLGELVSVSKGKKHADVLNSQSNGSVRYIQIEDLRNDTNLKHTNETGVEVNEKDIIIAWDGANAGTVGLNLCGYIGSTLARLRPKSNDIHIGYLGWFLRSKSFLIRERCYGATIPHVNKVFLESINVPLPSLSAQKQIATILDKADAVLDKRRQANELTEQFLWAAFLEMFGNPVTNPKGWQKIKFGDVCEEIRYGTSVQCNSNPISDSLPVLRIPNIIGGSIDKKKLKYACLPENERNVLTMQKGDILFVRSNGNPEYIARCALFNESEEYLFASYLIRARLKKRSSILPVFSLYIFNLPSYRSKMKIHARTTAGNYNINTMALRSLEVIVPPRDLQEKFASLVEKVGFLQAKQMENENELKNLFNSLMQKAFRGELFKEKTVAPMIQRLHPTDRHAAILSKIIRAHESNPKYLPTLGHVKGEKISHLIEYQVGCDLGRNPVRDAAGPVDYKHLLGVEHRAAMQKWFFTKNRRGNIGKEYHSARNIDKIQIRLDSELSVEEKTEIKRIIDLFLPYNSEIVEIAATTYAAWNDLLLEGKQPSDEEIVKETRENWTPEKLKFKEERFFKCIQWLRFVSLVPRGVGKHTVKN